MIIGAIHTVYGGRGGIDFFFERIAREITGLFPDIFLKVFCNKEAAQGLRPGRQLEIVRVSALENQYAKCMWLECASGACVNKRQVDLFWVPSGTNSFPGPWDVPVVATIHDIGEYHLKGKYSFSRTIYRKHICIPRTLARSTLLVAPSCCTAADVKRTLRYPKQVAVIHEAADPWSGNKAAAFDSQARPAGHENEIILCVGRLNFFAKGIDIILQGYQGLKEQGERLLPLVFAGPRGEGWRGLHGFVKKHGLQDSVSYLGEVSPVELEGLYARSCLVINASRFEGFGIPLLEAISRGKTVLCSDLEIFREIAKDAPVYFKSGDSDSFKAQLGAVLNRTIDLKKNIERGRQIAAGYSWQKTAAGYREIFDSVMRGRSCIR